MERGVRYGYTSCVGCWVCGGEAGESVADGFAGEAGAAGMAARMPRWVSSDGLTLLGFGAQIGAGVGYALARYNRWALLLVIACIVLNWFGDSMDGTLARVRGQQRPRYGFYVDHMVDVFGAVALMGGMACSGLVHWQVAMAMLVAFLLLSCESYLATYTLSRV